MAEAFTGEIRMISFDYAPDNWLFCDGQLLSKAAYTELFSLLGTKYGGNGETTFNLPNLNGKNLTDPMLPLGSNSIPQGQTNRISIPPPITNSTIPAQTISFTLLNTTVI